jgi:hypothetical protein
MSYGIFGGAYRPQALVKHKVFVSYHHHCDQAYYNAFSNVFHDTYDVIYDNSFERSIDSDDVNYVMRRIRENHITALLVRLNLLAREAQSGTTSIGKSRRHLKKVTP